MNVQTRVRREDKEGNREAGGVIQVGSWTLFGHLLPYPHRKTRRAVSPNTGLGTATGSGMGCDPNGTLRNERHVKNFQERSFLTLKNASWTHLLSHTLFSQKQESTVGFVGRVKRENETKS